MTKGAKVNHHVADAAPPPPSSRWSRAGEAAGWLHVTGHLLTDPATPDSPLRPDIAGQAEMCLGNLSRILAHSGHGITDTVFVKIYLKEFKRDFRGFNAVYARYLPDDAPLPS